MGDFALQGRRRDEHDHARKAARASPACLRFSQLTVRCVQGSAAIFCWDMNGSPEGRAVWAQHVEDLGPGAMSGVVYVIDATAPYTLHLAQRELELVLPDFVADAAEGAPRQEVAQIVAKDHAPMLRHRRRTCATPRVSFPVRERERASKGGAHWRRCAA